MNSKLFKLRDYMKLPYTVVLKRDEEGDFIARVKELEGCVADGQDEMEALANLGVVKELWLDAAFKSGNAIPMPEAEDELPSGKFLVRVPRTLHKKLVDLAKQEEVSLNQLVSVSLAETIGAKLDILRSVQAELSLHRHRGDAPYAMNTGSKLRLVDSPTARNVDEERVFNFAKTLTDGTWGLR